MLFIPRDILWQFALLDLTLVAAQVKAAMTLHLIYLLAALHAATRSGLTQFAPFAGLQAVYGDISRVKTGSTRTGIRGLNMPTLDIQATAELMRGECMRCQLRGSCVAILKTLNKKPATNSGLNVGLVWIIPLAVFAQSQYLVCQFRIRGSARRTCTPNCAY